MELVSGRNMATNRVWVVLRVVERAFRKLGTNHDLIPLYNKWFTARLPTGEKLNVAISPQLEDAFKVLDESEGAGN